MNILRQIGESFSRWIDAVAGTVHSLFERWMSQRQVLLVEEEQDTFTLHALGGAEGVDLPDQRVRIAGGTIAEALPESWTAALRGSRAELVLQPSRFMFRPLELPKRAAEFLEGIVRAQIDRLTPWTVGEVVYAWTPPVEAANERIHLTVAATARAMVMPYVQALADLGATCIVVSTVPQEAVAGAGALQVFEQRGRGSMEIGRIRRIMVGVLAATGLVAAASVGFSAIAADSLDGEQQELTHKIAVRRAAMRNGPDAGGSLQRLLERRKRTTPSSVIVLEALSQLLPDHTYVVELRIEGGKVQLTGITRDAPSLIRLIEQSPHFERATFFAPTTRSPGEPGERFHIEAQIKPYFGMDT